MPYNSDIRLTPAQRDKAIVDLRRRAYTEKGIESVKKNVPNAKVVDLTEREPAHN
jgi:hypothetical protein